MWAPQVSAVLMPICTATTSPSSATWLGRNFAADPAPLPIISGPPGTAEVVEATLSIRSIGYRILPRRSDDTTTDRGCAVHRRPSRIATA